MTYLCRTWFLAETEEKEIEVLTKLKETVDKQREELRKFKTEIKHRTADCDAVSCHLMIRKFWLKIHGWVLPELT
jgi:inorganic pyrophosphatase/exopolyphosphatase